MIRFVYQSMKKLWIKLFSGILHRTIINFARVGFAVVSTFRSRDSFPRLAFQTNLVLRCVNDLDTWSRCSTLLMNINEMYIVNYVNMGNFSVKK